MHRENKNYNSIMCFHMEKEFQDKIGESLTLNFLGMIK